MSTPLPPGFVASPDEPRPARPRPQPAPAGPAVVVHHHGVPVWLVLTVAVAVAVAVAAVAWRLASTGPRPTPPEPPAAEGVRVGRALAPALAEALAKGFDAAADKLEAGQTVGTADDALKATFDTRRKAAFAALGGPYLARIVPAGDEPRDDAVRKAFAEAHRAIAKGLRAGP
jgi:hypothetical protein